MIPKFYSIVRSITLCAALFGTSLFVSSCNSSSAGPVVLAASSTQQALEEVADLWSAQGRERPVLSFAASSALARQVASGAPADLFISADQEWMDFLDQKKQVAEATRSDLIGNSLVLIGARDDQRVIRLEHLPDSLKGQRLAIADPDFVPAGKYARAALQTLGLWDRVSDKLVSAENVRAALTLVERGQASLGIVYASDAHASDTVRVIATFPQASHSPIHYPLVRLVTSSHADADAFRKFLLSDVARATFVRHGFNAL